MRISFHHFARDVPGERHHRGIGTLRLGKSRNKCVAEIMETARHLRDLSRRLPSDFPAMRWFGGNCLLVSGFEPLAARQNKRRVQA